MSQPRESIFPGKLQQAFLLKILVITLSNATRSVEKTKCVWKKKPMEEEESMGCSGGWLVVTSVQWAKY